jgi:putative NIF3 family GTP cyclohydrolase 1 type 2
LSICIKDVLEVLTSPVKTIENTVDKLEYGSPQTEVRGIAVTFLATQGIIEHAKNMGINLIISHEGVFFSHWDKREALKADQVYRKKLQTIEESKIAIFRFHDYIHKYMPDGIQSGLLQALGWKNYEIEDKQISSVLEIPEASLQNVISYIKNSLGIESVRFVGDLNTPCRRVGIVVGYRGGGDVVIPLFEKDNLDLVICGEGPEWETPEYVRDAVSQGGQKALIAIGHAESETPGMKYLAQFLQERFPDVPVHFMADKPIFQTI